jgi:hypothetical protein
MEWLLLEVMYWKPYRHTGYLVSVGFPQFLQSNNVTVPLEAHDFVVQIQKLFTEHRFPLSLKKLSLNAVVI